MKYAIRPKGKELFYLGGLYKARAEVLPRFTILTRKAADGISFIHDRMPVIVPKEKGGRLALPADDARRAAGRRGNGYGV